MRLVLAAALAIASCSASAVTEHYHSTRVQRPSAAYVTTIVYDYWILMFDSSRLATSSGSRPVPISLPLDIIHMRPIRTIRIERIRCTLSLYTTTLTVPCGSLVSRMRPYTGWPPRIQIKAVR